MQNKTMTSNEIRLIGIDALLNALGPVNMVRAMKVGNATRERGQVNTGEF